MKRGHTFIAFAKNKRNFAAYSVTKGKSYGHALVTGRFMLEEDVSGLPNTLIIFVKGFIFLAAILFFIKSINETSRNQRI